MSRISDLTCNETMSDDAERGIVSGSNSLSRRYQLAPTQSPASFRVAQPVSRYTATSVGKPGARGGYTVASTNRTLPAGAHTIHRTYTVAPQPSHLSQINTSINNVQLSTSQAQQATANRIMRTHPVPDPGEYGLYPNVVMTHNQVVRPSVSSREAHTERVVSSRAAYRVERPPSVREERAYRQEPTIMREIIREELPQPQIVHRAHGVVTQAHSHQQQQPQMNLYINSMRLTQPPAPQATAKIGLGALHSVQQMAKNSDRSNSYSPSVRAYSTTPSGLQGTVTPTTSHQNSNPSRFTPVNGTSVHSSIVRPVPTTPARIIQTHISHHGLLQPPINPMTHAIPDSPTPIQQFVNLQRTTTTQSPRPSILRTPGSAAKRKLALAGLENTSCTNGNNSALSSAVRSLSATSITTVTKGLLSIGDASTTPEPSPRKRQRKQQLEPAPTLLEVMKQQQVLAAQAKAQLEAAQRQAEEQTKEAWMAKAMASKHEEPAKKKRGRPKNDGLARPTTAGPLGKTPNKPRGARAAAEGDARSTATQRFLADQEAKYRASQGGADDSYEYKPDAEHYDFTADPSTSMASMTFVPSNEPQPKSVIAQRCLAQQRAVAVQQYAAQVKITQKPLNAIAGGLQRPPQTATAPALAPATPHANKQRVPRIKHSNNPSTSKQQTGPKEETESLRPKRLSARRNLNAEKEAESSKHTSPVKSGSDAANVAKSRKTEINPVEHKILNYLAEAIQARLKRKSNEDAEVRTEKKPPIRTKAQIAALREAILKAAEAAKLPPKDINTTLAKAKSMGSFVATRFSSTGRPSRKPSAPQRGSTPSAGPIRRSISVPDGNPSKEIQSSEHTKEATPAAEEAKQSGKKVKISRLVLKKRVKMKKKKDDDPTKEFRGEITKPSKMRVQLPVISLNHKPNYMEPAKKHAESTKNKQVPAKKKSCKKYEKELNCEGLYPMQTRWASIFLAGLIRRKQQKRQVDRKLNKLKKKRQISTVIPMTFRKLETTAPSKSRGISIMAGMKPEDTRPNHFEQPKYVHQALTLRQEMISNLRKQQRLDRADNLIAKRSAKALLHENEMSVSHLCSSFETTAEGSLTDIDQDLLVESLKKVLQTRDSKNDTAVAKVTSKRQSLHLKKLKGRVLGLRRKGVNICTKKELRNAKEQIVQTLPTVNCAQQQPLEEKSCFDEHFASVSEVKELPAEFTTQLQSNKPVTVFKGRHSEALLCVSTSSTSSSNIADFSKNQTNSKDIVQPHLQQYFVVHRFDKEKNLKSLLHRLTVESDEPKKEDLRLQIRKEIKATQEEKHKTQLEHSTLSAVRKLRMESFDEQLKKLLQLSVKSAVENSASILKHTKKIKSKEDRTTTSPKKTMPTVSVGSIVEKSVVRLNKEDLPVVLTKRFFLEKHPPTMLDSKIVNCQLEMKKRKQILRYESNSAGVPVPRVSKVVNFRLPFPIEHDFCRPAEEQLKEELESICDTASVSGEVINLTDEKLEETQSINTEDCKVEEIKEEPAEETSSLAGRSATFAGSSSSSELLEPVKAIRKDKHLLILEEAMRKLPKKGKPTAGQPCTFSIPMLKCAPSPTTPKSQSRIKTKQEKAADKLSKEDLRPRSKSESDQNSKQNKEKIRTEKDKKKEDARKADILEKSIQEPKEIATSSEDSEKTDSSSCQTTTDVTETESVEGPVATEITKITRVYDSSDLKKIDQRKVISQRITERDGKLVKIIRMRKDPLTLPKCLLPLNENQVKLIKQCKKLPVKQFLEPIVTPLSNEDSNEFIVTDLLEDMVQYTAMMNDSAETEFETEALLAKAFTHPMNAIAPTFRSVIDVMQPTEVESVQLTENQFAVGADMQKEMWWKIAAKKEVPDVEELVKETKPEENQTKSCEAAVYKDNNDYSVSNTSVLRPAQRKAIKLVRPSKISRAVALLQQYSSRVEDQMTLESTTLLAFETFLQQYDPKAYHELQLNLLRDYEEGDTMDIVEEKKMLRLRHTILLPPIEFLPNKNPDYGDICKSVVMNPTEEFQNQVMKGCSTFWRGKLQGNPGAMHLNRYGHQIVDRCEGFIPLQSDHKEFYLEDVQDYADKTKFEKYYTMFEQTTEVTFDSRLNCDYDEVNENKNNLLSLAYNGVSRRAVLKQGSTEILFMGEKPVNGMISPVATYKLERTDVTAKQQNQVRNIREIFATSFKAMHETTQIMMQTRDLMVQSLALRSSREALRRLQIAKQRVRQTRVKTKSPKPNVVTLLKKLRRRLHRQKSLALRELSSPEKSSAIKEKQNGLKTKFSIQKHTPKASAKLGSMPPFKTPTLTASTPAAAVKRKLIPIYGSPTKKKAVEDNGKPAARVIAIVEKPIVVPKMEIPKIIEPIAHRGTVNRGGRPPLRKHGIGRGASVGDRKPVPEEEKLPPVPVVRGGVMGRGLGRGGSITRVARGSGLSRGAHRSISSSTSSSNNDIVGTRAPIEPVEKVAVVRKPHKPRVPKTPTIASDSTFERQMRRAIQESLRDVPSSSKTAAGK